MHYLDLPNLYNSPNFSVIKQALLALEPEETKDFDAIESLDKGTRQWLSRLASSDLNWINDEDSAEELRDLAARRLAMECGVTANSARTRKVELSSNFVVELVEPGMTEDNLGMLTWGSSLVLSRRLARQPSLVKDLKIVELGAGTGLCGITASLVGATSVLVTDLPEIVPNLAQNVSQNNSNCECAVLDWKTPVVPAQSSFDLVIVSDPVYSKEHPAWLLNAVNAVSADQILLQLPLRKGFEFERQQIHDGLAKQNYVVADREEEPGRDLFGDQVFSYTHYKKS